jgi:signal transduction histidine kinase
VPCQRASLVVFDLEAGEALLLAVRADGDHGIGAGTRLSLEGADSGMEALRRGEVLVVDDISDLPRSGLAVQAVQTIEGMRACIAAPLVSQEELLGSLNLWSGRPAAFGPEHVQIAREVAGSLAVAIQQARLFLSVSQKSEQLRILGTKLTDAEEAERRRLTRELHDRVGEDLTALNLNLSLARSSLPEDMPQEKAKLLRARLDDSLALVGETTDHIRNVMADLRPPMLDDYGLVATLHWYGARFASLTGAAITVEGEEPVPRLVARVEINLFRIAQEVLTNVAKHARAEHVLVTLAANDGTVRLVIADDGVGFDPAQLTTPDGDRGWGLMNMAERAEAMGGTFRVESRPHRGTRVIVEVAR